METNSNLPARHSVSLSLSKQIKNGIKIRDLKNDAPIREALAYAFVLVGLDKKNYPVDIEKKVLIDFVIGAYGSLLAEEIKEAFKMAVAHSFKDLDVNCYQKFSPEYFGRVMASYYIWRMAQLQKPQEITHVEPKFNRVDYYEKCLFEPFDRYMNGAEYPYSELDGWMFFDDLYKMGIRFANEDPEVRAGLMTDARLRVPKKERRKVYEKVESDEDHEKRIKKYAKHLAFKCWIDEKQFEDCNLRELIKPLLAR